MITVSYAMAWTLVTNANEPQDAECKTMMRGSFCTFGPSKKTFDGVSGLRLLLQMKRFLKCDAWLGCNWISRLWPCVISYHHVKTKIKLLTKVS